jgi:hypothetical protein
MTTTNTPIHLSFPPNGLYDPRGELPEGYCENCRSELATTIVLANHFDPDMDEDGRPIGWSRAVKTRLCTDCVVEYEDDSEVAIIETEDIT